MKIFKIYILAFLAVFTNVGINAQNSVQQKQKKVIEKFIVGYNEQNYSKMKKHFFFIAKVLPIKKGLKKELEPHFKKYGKGSIVNVSYLREDKIITELIFDKDTSEKKYLVTYFNKNGKITGLGIKSPDFVYPKLDSKIEQAADKNKSAKIDSLINKNYLTDNFNGCVLVIDNGKTIYKNAYGYSDYENKKLLNDSSVFYLASCSKQFTAMAIMMLYEKGKLNLSDTIQKYIPEIPYKNITIENLLTHTSGLPDYMELMHKYWDKTKPANNYDMIKTLVKHKPKIYFYPGELFQYSNTGYALLAVIVEKCSGMTFNEYMKNNIFLPIGMSHTFIGGASKSEGDKVPNWAYGHVYSGKMKKYILPEKLTENKNVYFLDPVVGDGNVNSSVFDIALWDKAVRENKLISKSTIEKSYASFKLKNEEYSKYGYGWFISTTETSERVVWHSGGWTGYHTFMLRFIDQEKTIIILTNNEYPNFMELTDKIARIIINK